jgi:type I restriction enzyme M protein
MESCLLVCRTKKPKERKGKIIFINGVNEVRIDRSNAWLEPQHIKAIFDAYNMMDPICRADIVHN